MVPPDDVTHILTISASERCTYRSCSSAAWWRYRLKSRRRGPALATDSILAKTRSQRGRGGTQLGKLGRELRLYTFFQTNGDWIEADVSPPARLPQAPFIKDHAAREAALQTERKSSRKRRRVSFPLLPGRGPGGPRKGKLLLRAAFWRWGAGSGQGSDGLGVGRSRAGGSPKKSQIQEPRLFCGWM